MPYYYSLSRPITTNGTTQTRSPHLRILSVANQRLARLVQLLVKFRHATAGGGLLQIERGSGTAASGGTSVTPDKRSPDNPAASTTAFHDGTAITSNTTLAVQQTAGGAQTGGTGGWTATEPDDAVQLSPNGGNNGNAEISSIAVGTSVPGTYTLEFNE